MFDEALQARHDVSGARPCSGERACIGFDGVKAAGERFEARENGAGRNGCADGGLVEPHRHVGAACGRARHQPDRDARMFLGDAQQHVVGLAVAAQKGFARDGVRHGVRFTQRTL